MSQQSTPYSLDTQERVLNYEIRRQLDNAANYLSVCMEILEECYTEASDTNTADDRKELLKGRFDFIVSYIQDKAVDFRMISKEIAET